MLPYEVVSVGLDMSESGHSRRFGRVPTTSTLPPINRHRYRASGCLKCAISGSALRKPPTLSFVNGGLDSIDPDQGSAGPPGGHMRLGAGHGNDGAADSRDRGR